MLTTAAFGRLLHLVQHDRNNLIQKIRKKIRNQLPVDKMFDPTGKAFWPINLTFEMTHLCNLSCYMCDLYGTDEPMNAMRSDMYSPNELMNEDDIKSLISEVSEFKPSISITGGEPMLSKNTLPLIREAVQAGLITTMTTNGYRLFEQAEKIVASGLNNITLSIDGVEETHDNIRGHEGTFQNLLKGLRELNKQKHIQEKVLPSVQFNVTMCGRNQNQLLPILEFAKENEINRVIFSHLWYWDEAMVSSHNLEYGQLAPVEVQNLRALEGLDVTVLSGEINRIKESPLNKIIDIKFLPNLDERQIKMYYQDSLKTVTESHCLAPWMNTRILPNGDVIPCIDSCWGNVKQTSFKEAWNSSTAKAFRSALQSKGTFPGCMRCCGLYSYQ